jgi:hypothetical protein
MPDRIEMTYYGADAERNVLDLYDAGRALYGVARFIYTLENFRVSGIVVEHATSARAKFELLTPRPGSFTFGIEHVVAAIGPENAAKILKVPLSAMVAWISKRMTGDKKSDVDPVLRQSVELEREKTTQITVAVEAMRDVAVAAIQANQASERRQSALIRRYERELSEIPEPQVRALESKLRPSLIDMARPTSSSASYMSLSVNREEPILYMDEQTAENLKGNLIDNLPELTSARFIQYNVETGWGKVRLPWRMAPYRFMVHPLLRPSANSQILAAMDKEGAWVWFYTVRDKSGSINHLLFDKFAAASEIPPP